MKQYQKFGFLLLLICLYLILDYHKILFLQPQGLHFWRQTDSLSFVANYFKNGFNFFEPQVFNLQSTEGKAGSEFPVLYYITALCYKIFGEHVFFLRLITLSIVSTGFFYLYRLIYLLFNDWVLSIGLSFLFFSSTILLYYSNNFLPDASAFGLTLIAWYFFYKHFYSQKNSTSLIIAFIFFSVSSLLKISFFINPIAAFLAIGIYQLSGRKGFFEYLKSNLLPISLFFGSCILILSWSLYIRYYNNLHHDSYFLISPKPIWDLNPGQIRNIWSIISDKWYSSIYYYSTIHVFGILILSGFVFIKNQDKKISLITYLLLLGSIAYVMLFYAQFESHDYYFIVLIPVIIFLVLNSIYTLAIVYPKIIRSFIFKGLVLVLCVLSINYASGKLKGRYEMQPDMYSSIGLKLSATRSYLGSIGVPENAKFIIVTDKTTNGALYFINRQGWPIQNISEINISKMEEYKNQGAEYILLTDSSYVPLFNHHDLIGTQNLEVSIFKIKQEIPIIF